MPDTLPAAFAIRRRSKVGHLSSILHIDCPVSDFLNIVNGNISAGSVMMRVWCAIFGYLILVFVGMVYVAAVRAGTIAASKAYATLYVSKAIATISTCPALMMRPMFFNSIAYTPGRGVARRHRKHRRKRIYADQPR